MPKYEIKDCKKHGNVSFVLEGRGYYRCTKCRTYQVQKRREKLKKMAVEHKGGQCQKCGYNKCISALEFHHLEPEHKDFGISHKGLTRSWDSIKKEIDKCILICSNCHREVHELDMGS